MLKILRCALFLTPLALSAAQAPKRIPSPIDDSQTLVLKGNTRPAVSNATAQDQGAVPDTQVLPRLSIHFALTTAQTQDLNQLLTALQTPNSPNYHKFLSHAQYADRFGLNTADIEKVTRWLEDKGFANIQVANSRTSINFSATAAQAQAAFHTQIHKYALKGQLYYANTSDPELPKALENIAAGVTGLHNFHTKSNLATPQPRFTAANGNHYLTPTDVQVIYNISSLYSSYGGVGLKLVVVGQSDVSLTDLRAFRTAAGLPARDPTFVTVGTDPGIVTGDELSSDAVIEWAGAIATKVDVIYITGNAQNANGATDALTYALENYQNTIITTSYGECEADITTAEFTTQNNLLAQGTAVGDTIIAASGNRGAADCDTGTVATQGLAVQFPASSAYVTAVGGTTFYEGTGSYWSSSNSANSGSAISYIPETTWDDGNQSASGGGASVFVAKPAWQTGLTPNDNARDVPDVSLAASADHDGYLVCSGGNCVNGFQNTSGNLAVVGGTSISSVLFAQIVDYALTTNGVTSGNINQRLYQIQPYNTGAFYDVTTGSNNVACTAGSKNCPSSGQLGYPAVTGYDQATGLGSINAYNLVLSWPYDINLTAAPASLNLLPGSSSSSTLTLSSVEFVIGYLTSGNASLSCSVSSTLPNVTCAVPSTLSVLAGTGTLTVTAGSAARVPLPVVGPTVLLIPFTLAVALWMLRKKRPAIRWSWAAFAALAISAISCGSGTITSLTFTNPSTGQTETGTVSVTANFNSRYSTVTIPVTVQ